MATALVTGASGFIGGHVVEALVDRGDQARCLVRETSRVDHLQRPGLRLLYGSVLDPNGLRQAVDGVDVVYHVAGMTRALRRSDLYQVNGLGTRQIARACALQPQPPVLILISSLAAAGPSAPGRIRSETERCMPVSHYGRSKRAGERAAGAFAGQVPTTIIRPGIVFGPRDPGVLVMFQSIARFGVHVVPTCLSPRISLIHVADLVEIILRAADRGARIAPYQGEDSADGRGYYFACDDQRVTYAQLGRLIGHAVGQRSVLIIHLPELLLWTAAAVSELVGRLRGRPEVFDLDKIREATAGSWLGCSEAAHRDLQFSPPKSLSQRLGETADWYREQQWL